MTVLYTEGYRLSNVLKAEYAPEIAYCREAITYNGPAADLVVGTVIGKVTASGKYKACIQTAVDGSATAAGILMEDKTVAATTDKTILALVRGPATVSKGGLVLDATYNLTAEKNQIYADLAALGIQTLDTVA